MKLDRNTFPPGGWQFYQKETKWNAPDPLIHSFSRMVRIIADHRTANPKANLSTDLDAIEKELEAFTRARLKMKPFAEFEIIPDKPKRARRPGCRSCGR